jgi:hypothetical protein
MTRKRFMDTDRFVAALHAHCVEAAAWTFGAWRNTIAPLLPASS